VGDSVDEDELETELRELLAEDKQREETEAVVGPNQVRVGKRVLDIDALPAVPSSKLPASKAKPNDLEERWKRLRTGGTE